MFIGRYASEFATREVDFGPFVRVLVEAIRFVQHPPDGEDQGYLRLLLAQFSSEHLTVLLAEALHNGSEDLLGLHVDIQLFEPLASSQPEVVSGLPRQHPVCIQARPPERDG